MSSSKFITPERINLKIHPEYNEKWVQEIIAENPSILGLGDLILKDKERIQPGAGRLDLLLQDAESSRRYEVEIQLGKTDETHIIRTIEYWDIEKKRYPQYDHCAVIIAEDITSRFLNIISLFNGSIPLIAIQMAAYKFEDKISLLFTKVMDELQLGFEEEDEEQAVTDRNYWESKGTKNTVSIADDLLALIKQFDNKFELKFNKFYIGLAVEGRPNNYAIFYARKNYLTIAIKLDPSEEIKTKLDESGLDAMEYDKRWGRFKINVKKEDVKKNADLLKWLLQTAYSNTNS